MLVVPLISLMANSINQKHKFYAMNMYKHAREKIEFLAFNSRVLLNQMNKYLYILCIPDDIHRQMNMYKIHHVVRRSHLKYVIHLDLLFLVQSVAQSIVIAFEKATELHSPFLWLSLLVHSVKSMYYHLPRRARLFEVLVKVLPYLL